jgi:hypothetical protein
MSPMINRPAQASRGTAASSRPATRPRFCAQTMAMIAIAPPWIAVALQKTKRNAGAGP